MGQVRGETAGAAVLPFFPLADRGGLWAPLVLHPLQAGSSVLVEMQGANPAELRRENIPLIATVFKHSSADCRAQKGRPVDHCFAFMYQLCILC